MDTAIMRGELEELRLSGHVALRDVSIRLAALPAANTAKTRTAVEESRRALSPALAAEQDTARWLIDRCTEQINRLGGSDYDAASRAYTLLAS